MKMNNSNNFFNSKLEFPKKGASNIEDFYNKAFNCDNRDIFSILPDNSIDMILTDPPYKDYQSNRPIVHSKLKKIKQSDFDLLYFLEQSARVLKDNSHFYCWCDHLTFPIIFLEINKLKELAKKSKSKNYLSYKNCLIWIKNNHGSGDLKGNYAPQHEFIIFASKGKGKPLNGKRKPNVFFKKGHLGIEFFKKVSNYEFNHGTTKPVEILRLLIEASSTEGDLVFDPYAGSMSTGEACILTRRNYLLIEIDKLNYINGINRLQTLSNNLLL